MQRLEKVWDLCMTPSNMKSRFQATSLDPCDSNAFPEDAFKTNDDHDNHNDNNNAHPIIFESEDKEKNTFFSLSTTYSLPVKARQSTEDSEKKSKKIKIMNRSFACCKEDALKDMRLRSARILYVRKELVGLAKRDNKIFICPD
ncbi:hypothetical protein FQR65_LT09576 [Abscondita terminalis]|nr:hypothetical protein FQR65_LT09576 [Abscondita terminalis]